MQTILLAVSVGIVHGVVPILTNTAGVLVHVGSKNEPVSVIAPPIVGIGETEDIAKPNIH